MRGTSGFGLPLAPMPRTYDGGMSLYTRDMGDHHRRLATAVAANDPIEARRVLAEASAAESPDSLDDLAALGAAGGELARELLLEHLDARRVVHRFVAGMLLDEAAVDDVAQDTLISIATSIGSYSGRSKFTTWVHRIARNRTVDHLRRQQRTAAGSPGHDAEVGPAARMSSMIATRISVQEALNHLPELYRVPVSLHDIDGYTYAEVAAELDLSIGTVKSQISRGRAVLAAQLRPALGNAQ